MKSLRLLTPVFLLLGLNGPLSGAVSDQAVRATVAGIDLVAYSTGVEDVVTFRGSLPAGDSFAPEHNIAVPTMVGAMLDQGTARQDKFALAAQLESVGATLSFSVDGAVLSISGKCLSKDLPLVIRLLAEQLQEPAFPPEELEKVKRQLSGDFQRALEDTSYRAGQAFSSAVYPPGHPNFELPIEDFVEAVNRTTVEDLRAFHQTHYGPAGFILVAVGDLRPEALQDHVERAFAGWSGGRRLAAPALRESTGEAAERVVYIPDKASVSVILGQTTGLHYSHPDALALRIGTNIFGSGFTGRLMANVRDREGLTYGIYSAVMNDTHVDGDWRIVGSFSPDLLDRGLASTRRQLELWHQNGVTPEEVEREKSNYIGTFKVSLATTGGMATALLASVQRGYGVSWPDELPDRVAAITAEQVNAAVRRHLRPDQFVLVKAGSVRSAAQSRN